MRLIFFLREEETDLQIDIFSKDLILVPINIGGMHWIAAVINMKKERIEYFDSMGSYGSAMRNVSDVGPSLPSVHKPGY
jgi:hypothetical protein